MDIREKSSNEKRLIDANALIKEANEDGAYGYVDAFQIANAPTVDAVEVVRCEKCKHGRKMIGNSYYYCVPHNTKMYADDFCSYGERKEGAN